MKTIKGYEAIEAKTNNPAVVLNKYNDPIEAARENITLDEAREIATVDPSLIYAETETTTDLEKYVVSVDTLSGEYVKILTEDRSGKPNVIGTTHRAEAIKYTRAQADRIAQWIGSCSVMLGEFDEYATIVNDDPCTYGDCTADEVVEIANKLQAMIEAEFPGINVRREKTLGVGKHPVTGPDELICEEINEWISDSWVQATEI